MASVRQKNGRWYYRITVTNGNGSHKYIERGSYRTKREALDAGKKAEVAMKEGDDFNRQKLMSFSFLSEEWLEDGRSRYKETTIYNYSKMMRVHILPILGDYNISAITYKLCQKVIDNAIATYHTRHRLGDIKGCMNRCFKYAIRCGYLQQNPAKDVHLPEPRTRAAMELKPSRVHRVIPRDELDAIFKRFPEGHSDYIPLVLGYRCGLRLGEAFGIFVDDIDFKKKQLHVRRQVQYEAETQRHYFTEPKYCLPGQERIIDLDEETCRILKKHVQKIVALGVTLHYPVYYVDEKRYLSTEDGKEIFPINIRYSNGTYISPNTIHHVGRIIHGLDGGVKGRFSHVDSDWNFHALRHTHASECVAAGMSLPSVQNRLGHKNLQTTYHYYIHETETQVTESRDILERMWK